MLRRPTEAQPHKKDSLKTFCISHFAPRPPSAASLLLLINIVFENFVYSVTICFNGEKVFFPSSSPSFFGRPFFPTTLENIQAFVHSFRQNEFYVTIMLNAQFWIWANATKKKQNWENSTELCGGQLQIGFNAFFRCRKKFSFLRKYCHWLDLKLCKWLRCR